MDLRKTGLAAAAISAAVAFGWSSQAHAGAVAYAHLDVFNFTLKKGDGSPLQASDFVPPGPNIANNTTASATLDGFLGLSAQNPSDVPLQCLGNCGGIGQNNFAQQAPFTSASFSRGDALLTGSLLAPGGAQGQGVAEVQLKGDYPTAQTSSSTLGTNATFTFTLQDDLSIRADFSAIALMNVQTDDLGGQPFAEIGFKITLRNNDTGQQVFSWTPDGPGGVDANGVFDETLDECNLNTNIGTGASNKNFTYNPSTGAPGGVCDFSGTVSLVGNTSYTLTITQTQTATATSVPEPGTLALLASGLVGLGALSRRRRK